MKSIVLVFNLVLLFVGPVVQVAYAQVLQGQKKKWHCENVCSGFH